MKDYVNYLSIERLLNACFGSYISIDAVSIDQFCLLFAGQGCHVFFPPGAPGDMPPPDSAENGVRIGVVSCPERTLLTIVPGHERSPFLMCS